MDPSLPPNPPHGRIIGGIGGIGGGVRAVDANNIVNLGKAVVVIYDGSFVPYINARRAKRPRDINRRKTGKLQGLVRRRPR